MGCPEHGRVGPWSASLNRYPVPTTPRVKAALIRTCHIDLRASADAMKAITDLQSGSRPRAILKIRPPSSLDYRARHGPQTKWAVIQTAMTLHLVDRFQM